MNRTHKNLENSPKLLELLWAIRTSNDTPSLISWITEDVDRVNLAGELASVSEVSDPASFQWLVATCGKVGFSVKDLQNRIRPVARALGVYNIHQDKDFYQLLGVDQNATEKEIRKAYRAKAYRIHPDTRDNHKMDESAFVALTTAYKTLSNPLLRREYNQKIHAEGIWNEEPKYQKHRHKNRPKSKVKYVFLFSVIFLFLAGTILFSDIIFNMSAMQDIDEQLSDTQSIRPVDSTPPSSQPTPNKQGELGEGSNGTDASSNSGTVVDKQDTRNLKQTVEPSLEASKNKKQDILKPDNKVDAKKDSQKPGARTLQGVSDRAPDLEKKQAAGISESAGNEHANTLTKRSETTVKPLASVGPIEKQKQARLQSEVKMLDLIKNPPTRDQLQSFLNRYTSVYQTRNENRFFNFFAPDAKENEQPLNRLFPIYRQTFRDFENIDYRIRLKEYVVDLNEAVIKIKGEYHLEWDSRQDGGHHSSVGDLSMSLVADKDIGYKIKALNY